MNIISIVHGYTKRIRNGRTLGDITASLREEVDELTEEVLLKLDGKEPGVDGINGECADVLNCVLDLYIEANPTLTKEELIDTMNEIITRKCDKWEKYYSNSITKSY